MEDLEACGFERSERETVGVEREVERLVRSRGGRGGESEGGRNEMRETRRRKRSERNARVRAVQPRRRLVGTTETFVSLHEKARRATDGNRLGRERWKSRKNGRRGTKETTVDDTPTASTSCAAAQRQRRLRASPRVPTRA